MDKPDSYKNGSRLIELSKVKKPNIGRYKKIGNYFVFIEQQEENEN